MSPILLIVTVAAVLTAEATISDLSRELLLDGFIWTNEDGIPTTLCATKLNNGSTIARKCTMTEGFGPRSLGCFSMWNSAGIIQQGCYSGQEISLRDQCKKGECVASRNMNEVMFCCCHGSLCNAKYYLF